MNPNILMYEHEVRERLRQRHREAEQERMLAGLPRQRLLRHLIGRLGIGLVAFGTHIQQLERGEQPVICLGTRDGATCSKGMSMYTPQIQTEEQLTRATPVERRS